MDKPIQLAIDPNHCMNSSLLVLTEEGKIWRRNFSTTIPIVWEELHGPWEALTNKQKYGL